MFFNLFLLSHSTRPEDFRNAIDHFVVYERKEMDEAVAAYVKDRNVK